MEKAPQRKMKTHQKVQKALKVDTQNCFPIIIISHLGNIAEPPFIVYLNVNVALFRAPKRTLKMPDKQATIIVKKTIFTGLVFAFIGPHTGLNLPG